MVVVVILCRCRPGPRSYSYVNERCIPLIVLLADKIDEVVWEDLYLEENIIDGERRTNASIDASNVYGYKPGSWRTSSLGVNSKYDNRFV